MSTRPSSGFASPQVCALLLLFTVKVQTTGQHVQPAPWVNQEGASTAVDQEETPESVAAMRQRLRALESTVSTMRTQLAGTGFPNAEANTVRGIVREESTGNNIPVETAVRGEDQQPRGFGDIMRDLAVELADLGTDLVQELIALAVLGTLCFLTSKAKVNVPTCTRKNMMAGKGPLGAADKGCGRWFSAQITSCAQVYTRETLLKQRSLELRDGCGVGNQVVLTTAHVDMDHANATAWPSLKTHRNTSRLSCAAQPSLRPSWASKQSVPFKPLTQCLLQCLEDTDSLKDKEPGNSDARSATLRTTAPCMEELDEVGMMSEDGEKIVDEEISDPVPAQSCCQREQTREEDGWRKAAQPLLQPAHVCKEKKHQAEEECSQVVREGPELHTPSAQHEQTQEVLDQKHEGRVRTLESEAVASAASSKAVAVEEVEEIEMTDGALDRAEAVEAEDREAGETVAEGELAEQQQHSDVVESIESPEMLEKRDVAEVEKKDVVTDGDEQLSGACDDARSSAAGWLVAVSSWFTRPWPTPPGQASSSTGLRDMPRPTPECSTDKTGKTTLVNRNSGRAGKLASCRTPTSTKDTGNILDFDEFEDDGYSPLTCGQRLLRVLVDSANACREQWSCKAQQPEAQGAQAPRRGEKMGRKRGRQQPRTTSQKQQAAKAPAVSKPVCLACQCPCGVPLTVCMSLMLTLCIFGRLNLDAIGWSPLLARDDARVVRASALTGAAETAAAAQQEAIERLEALKAEKGRLTLQHALLELESFQTEAADMMAKHPGIPEGSKMEGFSRDAKALHGALQELTGAEFPQVEDSYMQVLSRWKSTLASAKARLAGSGSCTA